MITGELRNRIDGLWDVFAAGGLVNPLDVIEQVTYLMFIHDLDDTDNLRAKEAVMLGLPHKSIFADKVKVGDREIDGNQLKWSVFHDFPAGKMYTTVQEWVFPFIKNLHDDKDSAYSKYMDDAIFKIPTPLLLDKIVAIIDDIYEQMAQIKDSDIRGDVYEYLLSKIAQSGLNGQFRTPRHIIRMMVEMMDPKADEVICDPACGTSGFLVAAGDYLKEKRKEEIFFNRQKKAHYMNGNEDKQGKPVIKIGNIQADGEISIEECVYTKETPQEKYFSQINDIYIALSGATTGKVGIMKREGFLINQRVGVVRLKNENVPINYLFSFLKSKTVTILHDAFGAAQPNISPKDLLNYEINIDKYVSMKAIAEKLDKVSGLIEKRKAQIEKLDLLIKSRFIEMFGDLILNPYGWKIVNITEVISGKVTNGFFAKRDEYIDNGNVSILGVANIINRMYSNVEDLPRTNGTPSDIQKFEVRYGDMLFCRSSLVRRRMRDRILNF